MKCIIIEDESKARQLLQTMLLDIDSSIEILASCEDLPSGVKAIRKYKPEVVFLDIELPGHSGLELLDFLNEDECDFSIVFTTGYSDFALQAFKLSAIDYLLKPIDPDMLEEAVIKAKKIEDRKNNISLQTLKQNLVNPNDKCISINLSNSTRFIRLKEIVMLQAEGSYCKIFLANGENILSSKNLKYYEERIGAISNFFRSHKSYVVNLNFVKSFSKSEATLLLENKIEAMVSTEKYDLFLQKMSEFA
jgi:two-component system, LytTR family, response regulator